MILEMKRLEWNWCKPYAIGSSFPIGGLGRSPLGGSYPIRTLTYIVSFKWQEQKSQKYLLTAMKD